MKINFPFSNVTNVQTVVTASVASVALFLSASVPTASVALFPKGPPGDPGPTVDVNGTQGAPGGFGPTGPNGMNTLVLSGSRAKCAGTCYQVSNSFGSPTLVEWTALDGSAASDSLGAFDTTYICSKTYPTTAATVTVGDTGCRELVTTIEEAQRGGAICAL